jgi:hypothetical protein
VKDEGSNLIIMTTTLKSIVKCEVLGNALVLAMFFLRCVNMLQLMKRFAKPLNLFLSSMFIQICKSV